MRAKEFLSETGKDAIQSDDLIVFDECALDDAGGSAFEVALRPTLDRPGSKACFISTPRGLNWYHDFYQRGFSDEPAYKYWFSCWATCYANLRATPEDIAEAKATLSKNVFNQEFMANFSVFEGQVYSFDADRDVLTEDEELELLNSIGKYDEFILGVDHGYRDPTSIIAVHYNDETEVFTVVDEYEKAEAPTSEHAENLQRFIDNYDPTYIFTDSAAASFRADLASDYDISTQKAKKSVLDGIAFVDSLLAQGKLRVAPSCALTIDALTNYKWDTKNVGVKERVVHDKYSHCADALRYALYSFNR